MNDALNSPAHIQMLGKFVLGFFSEPDPVSCF